ncbi:MAG: acyl-CoA synthetase [Rhodobacterales bacterium]|nr:MAG: acyl-CoA synthetase [Rhodobacterales bacterium]
MTDYMTAAEAQQIAAEMPWGDREVPQTMHEMLSGTAAKFGARDAVTFQIFSDPNSAAETLSWQEVLERSNQVANLFRSLGVGENDVVAFLLPNCNEAVLTYLGGTIAGIVNPINPLLDAQQIGGILNDTGAKVLVTLKSFPQTDVAQKAAEAVSFAPSVKTVLEIDLLRYITGIKKFIIPMIRPKNRVSHHAKVLDFNREADKQPKSLAFADATGDRTCAYFHTGGTTGMPKIAQHRYSGIVYNAWLGSTFLFTEKDVQMCPLPLFHVFATVVSLGASLGSGAQIVFPTPQGYRGDGVFDNFWKLIERYKATFMITVPTAISALMQRKVDADISSLQLAFSGSAPLPVELYKRFESAAGVTICEGYGLTEATCLVSINPPHGEKRIGSVGLPFPYTGVKIMDVHSHEEMPVDTVGEICVANPGVSRGHTYTDPAKNADLYYPGENSQTEYLRTGDLGRIDPEGYLWITGRAKDIIIRGGHNIDPAEIEEALLAHKKVAFAGAIGQPDAHAGEIPCVYVELVDGAQVSERELLDFAKGRIHERAAHPKHLEVMDELPKTAVGKIFKPDLRKMSIKRVYDHALAGADVAAEVSEVFEDKRRGLVARLAKTGTVTDEDVMRALGAYTRPWEWQD